ncbi:MAG: GH3 auxin-responsive promoter family protein [Pseudomonadota bacterium]
MASIITRFAHVLMRRAVHSGYKKFINQTNDLESVQRSKLAQLLSLVELEHVAELSEVDVASLSNNMPWEQFDDLMSVTEYSDWKPFIEAQRNGITGLINSSVSRYQPTSGSTSHFKLIPYTKLFIDELN